MMKTRKFYIVALSVLGVTCLIAGCRPARSGNSGAEIADKNTPLRRGLDYLLEARSADGLWHSPNYGNLRLGAGVTALCLYAASHRPQQWSDEEKTTLQASLDRLLPAIREHGYVTNREGPDYSSYGSAMVLIASRKANLELPDDIRENLVDYLVHAQLDEEEGCSPDQPDYGGWDLTGWMTGKRATTGTNISVTSFVLEALTPWRDETDVAATLARAEAWLKRCQNLPGDGGFFFHPRRDHDGNKAGWTDEARNRPNSYGTATADGLRCLNALGVLRDDERFEAAVSWLKQHPELEIVPGFENNADGHSWSSGLRYYYYHSLGKVLGSLPDDETLRMSTEIARILESDQRDDGSWSNPAARMREDDPLIATSFAVVALAASTRPTRDNPVNRRR